MGIIDKARAWFTSTDGIGDAQKTSPQHQARYFNAAGSGGGAAFHGWNPALRSAREDVAEAYVGAAARAIDALHNSGWIAGAVDQAIARTIGTGLRLAPRPDNVTLGWDEKTTEEWVSRVERAYILRAENPMECDAAGKHTIGELTAQFYKTWFAYGEGIALLPSIRRKGTAGRARIQPILPHRLVQDTEALSGLFQGIRCDEAGLPLSYRFKQQGVFGDTVEIAARDGANRPQVIHVFNGMPGQVRGITPLAPVLRVLRQYDQLADATLTAALLQTIFAATVESDAPTEEFLMGLQDPEEQGMGGSGVADLLGQKMAWYQQTKINMGVGGRLAHLFPGERLKFNKSEHPNEAYEAFSGFLLREVSRALGITTEEFTGDYNGVTYTGARLGTSANWPVIMFRRKHVCARFTQADYEAWLEEEIRDGRLPFPGGYAAFAANRAAACSADWRGPAKPQADDLKTAKAHQIYKSMGIMSDQVICDDLGLDSDDEYDQIAREKRRRIELGIEPQPEPAAGGTPPPGDGADGRVADLESRVEELEDAGQ